MGKQVWEQSVQIKASAVVVDRCLSEFALVRRWMNTWEPIGLWSLAVGSGSRQTMPVAWLQPKLSRIVLVREPGLVVWGFDGFLTGRDRWECQPHAQGTLLVRRWEVQAQGWLGWGWRTWMSQQMQVEIAAQLLRLKFLAEELYDLSGQD